MLPDLTNFLLPAREKTTNFDGGGESFSNFVGINKHLHLILFNGHAFNISKLLTTTVPIQPDSTGDLNKLATRENFSPIMNAFLFIHIHHIYSWDAYRTT